MSEARFTVPAARSPLSFCPECGAPLEAETRFCGACGCDMTGYLEEEEEPSQQFAAPEAYGYADASMGEPPLWAPWYGIPFGRAIGRFWRKYGTFSGRASRSEYWCAVLFASMILALGSLAAWTGLLFLHPTRNNLVSFWLAAAVPGVLSLVFLVPSLAVLVRRLHDADRSGGHIFMALIPIAGPIIVLVYLCSQSIPTGARFDEPTSGEPIIPATPYEAPRRNYAGPIVGTITMHVLAGAMAVIAIFMAGRSVLAPPPEPSALAGAASSASSQPNQAASSPQSSASPLASASTTPPVAVIYGTYSNARFGYSISVPTFLVAQGQAADGDGQRYSGNDGAGNVTFDISGMNNMNAGGSVAAQAQNATQDAFVSLGGVTSTSNYNTGGTAGASNNGWYAMSGYSLDGATSVYVYTELNSGSLVTWSYVWQTADTAGKAYVNTAYSSFSTNDLTKSY